MMQRLPCCRFRNAAIAAAVCPSLRQQRALPSVRRRGASTLHDRPRSYYRVHHVTSLSKAQQHATHDHSTAAAFPYHISRSVQGASLPAPLSCAPRQSAPASSSLRRDGPALESERDLLTDQEATRAARGSTSRDEGGVTGLFEQLMKARNLQENSSQRELLTQLQRLQDCIESIYRADDNFTRRLSTGLAEIADTSSGSVAGPHAGPGTNTAWAARHANQSGWLGHLLRGVGLHKFGSPTGITQTPRNLADCPAHASTPLRLCTNPYRTRWHAARNLYIWGGVGQGKTLLMDAFFDSTRIPRKHRVHFHSFMLDIQAHLHRCKSSDRMPVDDSGEAPPSSLHVLDPLLQVAYYYASQYSLLCLDEFQVVHIADAMILKRLFAGLAHFGCLIVTTSNRPPSDLYKGGLNRDRFLDFIKLVEQEWTVFQIEAETDFRLYKRVSSATALKNPAFVETTTTTGPDRPNPSESVGPDKVYYFPARPLQQVLDHMQKVEARRNAASLLENPQPGQLACSFGRCIDVPYHLGNSCLFTFEDLCCRPIGTIEYVAIASRFRTVFLYNLRSMHDLDLYCNEIRRFVQLIDVLYENRLHVVFDGNVSLLHLFGLPATAESLTTFSRNLSRKALSYKGFERQLLSSLTTHTSSLENAVATLAGLSSRDAELVCHPAKSAFRRHEKRIFAEATPKLRRSPQDELLILAKLLRASFQYYATMTDDKVAASLLVDATLDDNELYRDPNPRLDNLVTSLTFDLVSTPEATKHQDVTTADSCGASDNKFALARTVSRMFDMTTW